MIRLRLMLSALLMLAGLAACGEKPAGLADGRSSQPAPLPALKPAGLTLPAPELLAGQSSPGRQTSTLSDFVFIRAEDYDSGLPSQNLVLVPLTPGLLYGGDWDASRDPADLSYAMYSFDLTGLTPQPRVNMDWYTGPYSDQTYLAVANFLENRWDWFAPSGGNAVLLPALDPYINGTGTAIVVVMNGGPEVLTLGGVSIGSQWQSSRIVDYGEYGEFQYNMDIELAMVAGRPAVAYVETIFSEDGQMVVRFCRASDAGGSAWNEPVELLPLSYNIGHISLLVVNGRPALAWQAYQYIGDMEQYGSLYFMRALDEDGTAWGESVLVDGGMGDSHGTSPQLAIVNGRPAISYNNETVDLQSKGLMYVRALDSDGAAWDTPVEVKGPVSGGYGRHDAPLAVIAGRPAIAYRFGGPTQIGYIRASDENGTAWGVSTTIGGATPVGWNIHLQEYAGLPALVYDTADRDFTQWRVASNADGSAWGAPVVVHTSSALDGDPGSTPLGFVILDGLPVVLVNQYNVHSRVLCRADDTLGSAWAAPEHVTFALRSSDSSTLQMMAGHPAFVFVNGGQLNYSRLD